jgi:mRNA interferase HigB
MRVIAVSTLKAFWTKRSVYRDAEGPTLAWYRDVLEADVWINYPYRVVYIRFIGTHEQYDAIDAQTI